MKLREWIEEPLASGKEQVIGREIQVQGSRALLLGLRETAEADENGEEYTSVWLDALIRDSMPEEEDWDEDDEEEENQTNRQSLIESLKTDGEISPVDIEAFVVNGRSFETEEMEVQYLELEEYEAFRRIRHYLLQGAVPDSWSGMETEELAFARYAVDPDIFEIDWNADILNVSAEYGDPITDVLVGKVIKCRTGKYETPKSFIIKGRGNDLIQVKLYGMELVDIWNKEEWPDAELMEDMEMEEFCEKDERLLVLEYETDAPVQLDFYTKEFLDEPVDMDAEYCGSWILFGDEEAKNHCVLDVVPKDFDEEVEVELLSYSM